MKLLPILITFIAFPLWGQMGLGEVIGTVVDEFGYPIWGAVVYIDDDFNQKYQAQTDETGKFRIRTIPVDEYELSVRYMGDTLKGIFVDVPLDGFYDLGEIIWTVFWEPPGIYPPMDYMIPWDLFRFQYYELDTLKIEQSVDRFDLENLVSGVASDVNIIAETNELTSRGFIPIGALKLIDGVKVRGDFQLPSAAYQNIRVYTGGIPAKYGDTNGMVIEIETKSYFDLYEEWYAKERRNQYYRY